MRSAERVPLDRASRGWALAAAAACLLPLLPQLPATVAAGCVAAGLLVTVASRRRPLPGWIRALLALCLVGMVLSISRFSLGRDTACALLAAMLAIKPGELATLRDARSLVGFALFAPFSTFLLDQGPLSLALGLLGAVVALGALAQLSEQESLVGTGTAPRERLVAVGRLLLIGLPLALAAFWLFPRLGSPLWGVPERVLARPGLSDDMAPGEWLDMMNDERPVLRVSFFGEAPPQSQMYWRGPVLMDYDGRTWTRARRLQSIPAPETTRTAMRWDYEMVLEPSDRRTLVALELPDAAPPDVQLSWDYTLESRVPLGSVTRWRMQASPPRMFEPQLPPFIRESALRLPAGFNPRTVALARQWRAELGPEGDAAIVERAMAMIRAEFGYTLSTPLPGRHAADEFLFDWKQGFCEHYSSGFVILMRAAGIPSRVVTGYAGGTRNRFGGYWVVRNQDAHAWAEVWLEGRGWVRVDPTAAVAPERIYDTIDDRAGGGFGALPGMAPMLDVGDWLRRGWNDLVLGFDATRQMAMLRPLGLGGAGVRGLIVLFAICAGLALAWMLWLAARAERSADPVLAAWRRMGARYARRGLARAPHEPALQWARRVAGTRGGDEALLALTARFERWRYAPRDAGADPAALVRDLRKHRPR
jgi:transglutaminase-like putative cysteine protease